MTAHRAKSERGIKALPDGKFEYTIRFKGKLVRKVFPTKGICKAQREKRMVELREGYYGPPKAPTFEAVVEKFLEWSEASVRPKTHTWDKWISGVWLAYPAFAGKKLDRITPADVEQFKQEQRSRTRPARAKEGENASPMKVSPRLVDACLARLRRLFSLSGRTSGRTLPRKYRSSTKIPGISATSASRKRRSCWRPAPRGWPSWFGSPFLPGCGGWRF